MKMITLHNKYWLKISFTVFTLLILLLGSQAHNQRSEVNLTDQFNATNTVNGLDIVSMSLNPSRTNSLGLNGNPKINVFDCGGVSGTTITGLNLVNTSLYVLNCPQSIVRENIITSSINPDNSSLGIKIFNSPGSLIRGNEISDIYSNNISNTSVGILLIDSDDTIIEKNTIFNVTGTSSIIVKFPATNGILIENSSNVTISTNVISRITGGYVNGIYANGTGNIIIDSNTINNITGHSGITAGIFTETYDYAEVTSNTISNLHTLNTISSPLKHMTIGISTFMLYTNKYVQRTLIQGNILENISITNTIGQVDLIGIGSFSDEDTISQNTITNLTIVSESNVGGLIAAVASLSPTFANGNSTVSDNIVSDLYISDGLLNGSMFGFYLSSRYSANIRNNQINNVNNSANFVGGGQTRLYYYNTILNLNFTDNSISQITSTYPVSEVHLKISENYGADQYSLNFEFTTNNRLDIVIEQPLIVSGYDSYEISRDGTAIEVGSYDSSQLLVISPSELEVGDYMFSISYLDTIGNNPAFSYNLNIIVNPTVPIVLDDLTDIILEQGTIHTFQWNVIAFEPLNYQILINGTEFENIVNSVSSIISFELPSILGVGLHNITIIVDNQILFLNDSLYVQIIDTTTPTITQLEDIFLGESFNKTSVSWIVYDLNPGNYTISVNNQSVTTGLWNNNVNITTELLNLTTGDYSIEIIVQDNYGNLISDELMLIIGDFDTPTISSPGDIFMNEGEVGKIITWVVFDDHPATFEIGVNGIREINSSWDGEVWISFELDGLDWGFYNISLTLDDVSGNDMTDWVFVRVYNQLTTSSTTEDDQAPVIFGNTTFLVGAGIVVGVVGIGYGISRRRG